MEKNRKELKSMSVMCSPSFTIGDENGKGVR